MSQSSQELGRASRLTALLFGTDHMKAAELGFVGVGTDDTIHVYVHGSKRMWHNECVVLFEGHKVVWHYKVGPIVALEAVVIDSSTTIGKE